MVSGFAAETAPAANGVAASVRGVAMRFGANTVFQEVSFEVRRGEVCVILGGSGCGKSTLLKLMIGLRPPSEGSITVLGEDIVSVRGEERRRLKQRFGVAFQSGALSGSMAVLENVALPMASLTRLPPAAIERIARASRGRRLTRAALRLGAIGFVLGGAAGWLALVLGWVASWELTDAPDRERAGILAVMLGSGPLVGLVTARSRRCRCESAGSA